ncbi:CcmD family protein [Chloroflexota bacterium]
MENFGYLLGAFSMAWALVFGYVLLLLKRQRRLQQEINALKEAFKEKESEQ